MDESREVCTHLGGEVGDSRRERDFLRRVLDAIPVGVTVQDEDGGFLLVNRAASSAPWPARSATTAAAATELVDCDGKTMLMSQQSARIFDRAMLISTSLDVTERREAEGELERRANFDELTGLANHAQLEQRVGAALRRAGENRRFALAFIDLDNFKHINDYYSHAIGDALLLKAGQRMAGRLRRSDLLARLGGDEFVLLIDPVESEQELRAVIDRVSDDLQRPFYIQSFEVLTSASIGVSLYPEHGRCYEALRRSADSAMYRAKHAAKGAAAFYDTDMGQAIAARMELEQRLRLAIRDRRFRCAFQPKVDFRSQQVVGLEALIRWCDEQGTINPPGNFIGLAVELGLIDPITRFMLGQAVESLDRINAAFGPDTTISVNVAARQAGDASFMRALARELHATQCPHRFMLEVTEDAFVAKGEFQSVVLPMLREIGVKVSIDDFGTGYSSLSALADITVDEVKVDRSFITDIHQRPRSQSVLKAIESLSQALGMSVVAEGIETFEELAFLQAATRIRFGQGYYFARPFFIEEIGHARPGAGDARPSETPRERPEGRARASSRAAGFPRRPG
jgi:diguanylate cyclase (GGDEF)-like protein